MITINVYRFDELSAEIQKSVHEKYAYKLCDYYDFESYELRQAIDKVLEDLGIERRYSYYNQQDYIFKQETSWDWPAGPQQMRRLFLENFPDVHEWHFWTETIVSEIWKALRKKKNENTTDVMREAMSNVDYAFEDYMCDYYNFDQFESRLLDSDCYFTSDGVYVDRF